jgi:hypothetical protein
MKLYIFQSEMKGELRAFCADIAGSKLPDRFRPWRAIGVVRADAAPPHKFPRGEIEKSVELQGFQLWRLKANSSH